MRKLTDLERLTGLADRFGAFVAERYPFGLADALDAFEAVTGGRAPRDESDLDRLRSAFRGELTRRLHARAVRPDLPETTPRVPAETRLHQAYLELVDACDGLLRRVAIEASLTPDERREILRGMLLTRATDNRLKMFFASGEIRYRNVPFQGKGFRSLGQEAIYAAGIRLRRGSKYWRRDGRWQGDVIGPLIRDLGVTLAMAHGPENVRMVLNAQMGKVGPPSNGKDFTIGDFTWGSLAPASPLTTSTLTLAGMALAFAHDASGRIAISFIGEGGSSLGEWHEAINFCAARRLPAIFCIQNNQLALSTPVSEQSAVRVFADKAAGYGIPASRSTVPIRTRSPVPSRGPPSAHEPVRVRRSSNLSRCGCAATPITMTCCTLVAIRSRRGTTRQSPLRVRQPRAVRVLVGARSADRLRATPRGRGDRRAWRGPTLEGRSRVDRRRAGTRGDRCAVARRGAGRRGGFANESPRVRVEVLDSDIRLVAPPAMPSLDEGPPVDPNGRTFLEAVMLGIRDALHADPRVFVFGEDVGGTYGNAFLLLRPLLKEFGDRIINAPLAEGAVLGVVIGAALAGQRPIGELQFNDFVATGFNQLVNNAAKIRYRWGGAVPVVVRMPWVVCVTPGLIILRTPSHGFIERPVSRLSHPRRPTMHAP